MDKVLLDWFEKQPRWKQNDILSAQYFGNNLDTFRGKIVMAMKQDGIEPEAAPQFLAINTVADFYVVAIADTQQAAEAAVLAKLEAEGATPDSEVSITSGPIMAGNAVNIDAKPADWRWFHG
jgi:hypothetical protein